MFSNSREWFLGTPQKGGGDIMKFFKFQAFAIMLFLSQILTFSYLSCVLRLPRLVKMVVKVPVAGLRLAPELPDYKKVGQPLRYPIFCSDEYPGLTSIKNPLQDTQLLYGERVNLLEDLRNGWLRVQVLDQKTFVDGKFKPKEGFIEEGQVAIVSDYSLGEPNIVVKALSAPVCCSIKKYTNVLFGASIGTKFFGQKCGNDWYQVHLVNEIGATSRSRGIGYIHKDDVNLLMTKLDEKSLRQNLVNTAMLFLDSPYSWGGRSGFDPNVGFQTGVDCSSFINLVYRVNRVRGIDIPRDAGDQFKACKSNLDGKDLKPGDLIFSANAQTPQKINHVLMYLGDHRIIESIGSEDPFGVRIILDEERFGLKIEKVSHGQTIGDIYVYFGTFFK